MWWVFALGSLLWTGSAVAVSALACWGAQMIASGGAAQLGQAVTSMSVPMWLTHWVDIATLHAMFDGIAWTLQSAQQALPWLGTLLKWLLPLIWVMWAVGIGVMLLLAFGLQWLARRFGGRPQPVPA